MPNSETQTPEAPNFTESTRALDLILDRFKSEALPLEVSLALFEEGVGHLKVCQEKLTEARGRVEELVKSLQTGGESVTRPFDA